MNLYNTLEAAICSNDILEKEALTAQCLAYCNQNEIREEGVAQPRLFDKPSYADLCEIVSPKTLPMRKDFDSSEGLATLVHAIAHIEYSAIDLALDDHLL